MTARGFALAALIVAASACGEGDAGKAWSGLATCLAGSAAQAPLAARVGRLRLIQIENTPASGADAWPARCAPRANELFAATSTSGKTAILRRKLQTRLNCGDEKGSCVLPSDDSLISISTELWEAAGGAGLEIAAGAAGAAPKASAPPLITAPTWKSFSPKPLKVLGPALGPDGRGALLLTPGQGRVRPLGCEFPSGFGSVRCFASDRVPELPGNDLSLVVDRRGLFAAGLSEDGLVAYHLESGEPSDVRGIGQRLAVEGVAVERRVVEDPKAKAVDWVDGAPPARTNDGFEAFELKAGKAGKPVKFPISPIGEPLGLGGQIAFLAEAEGGPELVVKTLAGGKPKDVATLKGSFAGPFHSCRRDERIALATYGAHPGQHGAKPTTGDGKTGLSFSEFRDGAWSEVAEAALPFERALDSDLVCTASGASVAWVQPLDGGARIGRLDCSASGCKANDVKLPGLESKWWWSVGPLGDKVFVLYRSNLGDTRLRVAPLADLPAAKDVLVFDSPDFGGPNAGQVATLVGPDAALLIFRDDQPVALRIGADGSARVLTP